MPDARACPFCAIHAEAAVAAHGVVYAVRDLHPVSPGHTLLIPRRHVAEWWSLDPAEKRDLDRLLDIVRIGLEREHRPNGYNVGFNDGAVAGQTIPHFHLHVVPRYGGDVADPADTLRRAFASEDSAAAGAG